MPQTHAHSSDNTELLLLVGRIDGKMDLMLTQAEGFSKRLADLEGWKNRAMGIVLALSTIAGLAGSQLSKLSALLTH